MLLTFIANTYGFLKDKILSSKDKKGFTNTYDFLKIKECNRKSNKIWVDKGS